MSPSTSGFGMFFRSQPPQPNQLELKLGIASPTQWGSGSVVSPAKLLRNLDDELESPQQLLREALFQARSLNRSSLSAGKRLKLSARLQQRLWPTLAAARDALRNNEYGVPEPEPQRELLDAAQQVIHALSAGYQLVVEADYRQDERHGRAEQARILEAAVRVLELTHLHQRLRALRFQPLPAPAWQAANTLFCVLCRASAQEAPVPALCDDRLLLDADGSTRALRIYTLIQAFGLFDCFTWSKRHQRFLDIYCASLPKALVISYQPKAAMGGIVRFTHAHQDSPPRRSAAENSVHRVLIDCNGLAAALRQHQDAGRQHQAWMSGASADCLAGLPPLARRPILRTMLRSLEHGVPPHQPREQELLRCDFRLETGFERTRQHLHTVFTSDPAKRADLASSTLFAARSAAQSDDADSGADTQWLVLQQSDRHTVVSTQETRYTKPLALGALAVYGIGDEGFMRPAIGEVARIVRLEDEGRILLGIVRRARFATPVNVFATVGQDTSENTAAQVACLLAYDDELGWCLISSPRSSLPLACPIQIRTKQQHVASRLRRLHAITPHFMLFELDAMKPCLATPSYPSARRRYRQGRMGASSHRAGVAEPVDEVRRTRRNAS
ncbi:hypothetical protein [Thiohalocapsa halophila]|nr:hypothetical protein [Thiohalocapsa halophila]